MPLLSFSQQINLTGTWIQVSHQLVSGKEYANAIPKQLGIDQDANTVTIRRVSAAPNGHDTTAREMLKWNGDTVSSLTASKLKRKSTIKLTDHQSGFTELSSYTDTNGVAQRNVSEVWAISPDGKTLTIDRTFESAKDSADKWTMKGVYRK